MRKDQKNSRYCDGGLECFRRILLRGYEIGSPNIVLIPQGYGAAWHFEIVIRGFFPVITMDTG